METLVEQQLQNTNDYEIGYALEKEKAGFKRDMGWFGKYCFPKALAKDTPSFHRDIYKSLKDDETKRVLIAAPRGTAEHCMFTYLSVVQDRA